MPILLLLLGVIPRDSTSRETVDLIEVNHFFDEHGRLVFDQVIFYDWSGGDGRYNVRAWRLVKKHEQLPEKDWQTGYWTCHWQDGEQTRHITSRAARETWTQWDVELAEREVLPKEKRKELLPCVPKRK